MTDNNNVYEGRLESVGLTRCDLWPQGDNWLCNCVVIRDGEVLLLRRSYDGFLGGQWDIPGGKLDAGEQPDTAAARELFEETGLQAASVQEAVHFSTPDNQDSKFRFHTITFRVTETDDSAPVRLSDEHPEFRWASKEELSSLRLVNYVRQALDAIEW